MFQIMFISCKLNCIDLFLDFDKNFILFILAFENFVFREDFQIDNDIINCLSISLSCCQWLLFNIVTWRIIYWEKRLQDTDSIYSNIYECWVWLCIIYEHYNRTENLQNLAVNEISFLKDVSAVVEGFIMVSEYNIDFHHLSLLSENKPSCKWESISSDDSVDAGEKKRFFLFKEKKDDSKISLNCVYWWEDVSDFLTFFSAFRVA